MDSNAVRSGTMRRRLLGGALGTLVVTTLRPAAATPQELAAAIDAFAVGAPVREGRVTLRIAQLVDNGNTVPITVEVDSPMTVADHVKEIAVYNEQNPQRDVIRCELGPRCGRAQVATRMRLATSQKVVALARMSDGSVWSHGVDVVVTLASCIEG